MCDFMKKAYPMKFAYKFFVLIPLVFATTNFNAALASELPARCESRVEAVAFDPHQLVMATRVMFNFNSDQATITYYKTRAVNLTQPRDIFKPDFEVESLFYTYEVVSLSHVILIKSSMDQVIGTISHGDGDSFWLKLNDGSSPESLNCFF